MENINYTFWLGLALAIPLSIIANIFTPKLQQSFAKHSQSKAKKRIAYLQEIIEEHKDLGSSPEKLHTFLLESILLITLLTSVFAAISGSIFALSSIIPDNRIISLLGQLVSAFGAATISKECFSTLIKSKRAKRFTQYQEEIEKEISQLAEKV
jgi:H+/gluconate symporter-like permease